MPNARTSRRLRELKSQPADAGVLRKQRPLSRTQNLWNGGSQAGRSNSASVARLHVYHRAIDVRPHPNRPRPIGEPPINVFGQLHSDARPAWNGDEAIDLFFQSYGQIVAQ